MESFEQFIKANLNKIAALQIVCTRPKDLDRKSLRELLIELDSGDFADIDPPISLQIDPPKLTVKKSS